MFCGLTTFFAGVEKQFEVVSRGRLRNLLLVEKENLFG